MASVRPRTSIIWDFFDKKDSETAQCRICAKEYSHRSTSNLKKHLDKKHPTAMSGDYDGVLIENLELELDTSEEKKPPLGLSTETEDKLASSDDDGDKPDGKQVEESDAERTSNGRRTSDMWYHFRRVNKTLAECNVCRRQLSYASNISNLRKHWRRKHGRLSTESRDLRDQYYLPPSSPLTKVFLKGAPPPETERRRRRVSSARTERYSTDSEDTPKKFKRKQRSDAYEPPYDDDIDHFGRYVTALLKKLPTALSNKMQMDIVTLIMNTQMQHELTQTACETSAVGTSGVTSVFDGAVTSHST